MSKLTTDRFGNVVIESTVTAARIQRATKYVPEAMYLKDENGDPTFAVNTSKGSGSISKYGVSFGGITTDGFPFVAIADSSIPADPDKKHAYLLDNYGLALFKLNAVEAQMNAALDATDADISSVAASITIQ